MGAKLVITGRNEVRLQETLKALEGEGHLAVVADLTNEEQMDRLVEQVPALYGLVNNAGVTETLPTQFIKREKLEKVLEINTIAPILLTQKLLKIKDNHRRKYCFYMFHKWDAYRCVWKCTIFYF